jgi:Ni,Fe-hydrogenase III component G
MKIPGLDVEFNALSAPVPIWHAQVTSQEWSAAAGLVRERGGRLLALWAGSSVDAIAIDTVASDVATTRASAVFVSYVLLEGVFWLALPLDATDGQPQYPDLSAVFPVAGRMQRAAADLSGIHAQGARDQRPWLNHGAWAMDHHPLLQDAEALPQPTPGVLVDYPFVRVEGDGVHEIAVGPVHAGIIEPGHFRFSVVGEKVLRLEQRLGYTHKGIEQRMTQMCGAGCLPPGRARVGRLGRGLSPGPTAWRWNRLRRPPFHRAAAWLRALLLERERVWPTTWATWARWAMTLRLPSRWRSSRACAKTGCAIHGRPLAID